MTITIYSGITIIYICLMIVAVYAAVLTYKHKKFNFFNLDFDHLFGGAIILTMIYCFITAITLEHITFVWSNFIFVLCVVGGIVFAGIICSGIGNSVKEKINEANIKESIHNMTDKRDKIDAQIKELNILLRKNQHNAQLKTRTEDTIKELTILRDKYSEIINELIIQKTLNDAKLDNRIVETIKLTSKKTVVEGIDKNLDKFDSVKELEDVLSSVRNLMKNYK